MSLPVDAGSCSSVQLCFSLSAFDHKDRVVTARAGLDPWCRFFGVPNLFVVDASFMPSSGGVNPSLTIAANALRVGEHLVAEWDQLG